jgi:glycosyltransferase involved in cell wall biosynthesis
MARSLLAVAPVSHPGGAETTLLRLLAGLEARGWAITLATPGPGAVAEAGARAGWGAARLPVGGLEARAGARAVASWPRAARLAGRHDVVYLNGTVCGRLLPALRRARVVLHVHDIVARVPGFWRRADVVLAASQAVAARLHGLSPHVVYPPVDADPPEVTAPWEPTEGPIIGYVGRIEPRKGALDLARAAPAIRAAAPGARVVLVGDDDYGTDPAYAAAVRGSEGVEHYGWIEGASGLMRHLDVLVLPSSREPAGTVLAEAMAVGTPVVATRVDGLPEVVRDGITGLLVEPGRPDELARAVLEVLGHRSEMGAAAARHARRFHTHAYTEQVERLIRP